MNTRHFFKSLALLAAGAAVSPGIFIPKFEPVRWKVTRAIPNPDWVNAEGEYRIIMSYEAARFFGRWAFVEGTPPFVSFTDVLKT